MSIEEVTDNYLAINGFKHKILSVEAELKGVHSSNQVYNALTSEYLPFDEWDDPEKYDMVKIDLSVKFEMELSDLEKEIGSILDNEYWFRGQFPRFNLWLEQEVRFEVHLYKNQFYLTDNVAVFQIDTDSIPEYHFLRFCTEVYGEERDKEKMDFLRALVTKPLREFVEENKLLLLMEFDQEVDGQLEVL